MDRGAWLATVHRVAKSWTRLSDFTHTHIHRHTHTHRMKRVLEIGCTVMGRELTILIRMIKNHPDGKFMLCAFPTVLKNLMRNKNGT